MVLLLVSRVWPQDEWAAIVDQLHQEDPATRFEAIERVRQAGPRAAPLVPDLVMLWNQAAATDDERTTRAVVEALTSIGPTAVAEFARAHPLNAPTTVKALLLLGRQGSRLLGELLGEQSEDILREAAAAAPYATSADVLPPILEATRSERTTNRAYGAYALVSVLSRTPGAVDERLPVLLRDPSHLVRKKALDASRYWLSQESLKEAAAVTAALAERLTEADADMRSMAADALGRLGPLSISVGPAVTRLLSDPAPRVRISALLALRAIKDCRAAAAVRAALDDQSLGVANEAARTLVVLAPDDVAAPRAAVMLLGHPEYAAKKEAVAHLKVIGYAAEGLRARIAKYLHSEEPVTRACAARVLLNGGDDADEVVACLLRLLQEEEPWGAEDVPLALIEAIDALESMGKAATPAIERLRELSAYDSAVGLAAQRALKAIQQ